MAIDTKEESKSHRSSSSDEVHGVPVLRVSSRDEIEAHAGVAVVKATHRVYGRYSKWALFTGLGLASYIYSLDAQTTWSYLAWAASELQDHSLISTIQVAQSIIIACGKPAIAKFADVKSRGVAYVVVLVFYVLGYIVIASAHNIQTVAGGIILYAVGYTGLQLLTQIIIADITTLEWRGAVSGLTSLPFVINAFIGSNISSAVLDHVGWRWGYGMFAILIPASLAPLIVTLLWAELKAKRLGLVPKQQEPPKGFLTKCYDLTQQLDVVGLVLIGSSVALILLPLTLANTAKGRWHNPSMIAMEVVGCVLLPLITPWEFKFARFPVFPGRFISNRSVMGASLIGFFDFISFYLTYTYLYSFVTVVKPWTTKNTTYFVLTQSVGLTVFGICAGFIMRYTHRYKLMLIVGLCIRLFGVGLMIHSRGANGSDAEIVWTQIIQSMGGGIASVTTLVAAQASVPHIDVATASAMVLLITEIGGAIGSAVAGAIWTNNMPEKLARHLPFMSQADRDAIYASIYTATAYARGTPIREGVISAYSDVMKIMLIVAASVSVVPLAISLFMPEFYLGSAQNAVDEEDLAGNPTNESQA